MSCGTDLVLYTAEIEHSWQKIIRRGTSPSRAVPSRPEPGKASQSVGGPSQTLFGLTWVSGAARDGTAALGSSEMLSAGSQ